MAVKKRFPYKAAFVACNGGCRATAECQYGCVGCELCVNVCKFEAIALNEYGVAEVDEDKCIACGKCVRECPRELILPPGPGIRHRVPVRRDPGHGTHAPAR